MRTAILLAFAAGAFGQMRGPQLGWLLDNDRLRPIHGIPGAASLGSPGEVNFAALVLAEGTALGLTAENRAVVLITPAGSETLSELPAGIEKLALSPKGSAGLLYAAGRVYVLRGRSIAWEADLSFFSEAPRSMAISDDGSAVIASSADAVYKLTASGVEQIPVTAQSLAFLFDSRDFVLATESQVLLSGESGLGVVFEGLKKPVGIAATAGNSRIIVADAEARALIVIDRANATAQTIECDFQPETLERFDSTVFRLTSAPLRIFDAQRGEVLIIPPAVAAQTEVAQ
jgi:hypothetical protein